MSNVTLSKVNKQYGAYHALRDVELEIATGDFVVMVGPSGCGKSTLLKTIAGLEAIGTGTIEIGGRNVTHLEPGERGIAMVFQSYALYPHMTVWENMAFGLRIMRRPRAEINAAVQRAAQILRIASLLQKKPGQLSGGQRQRVAIGRAITRQPEVFLFDEPLSNLDAALRTQMRVELASLHRTLGSTMIYVTHDQVEAMTMADQIVVLRAGEVEQVGRPLALYHNPRNRFVASFLGSPRMNFFEGIVANSDSTTVAVEIPGLERVAFSGVQVGHGLKSGDKVTIGVRPEHLRLNPEVGVCVQGELRLVEQLGRETVLYVQAGKLETVESDTGTTNVAVLVGHAAEFAGGSRGMSFGFNVEDAYLFDSGGVTVSAPKSISGMSA